MRCDRHDRRSVSDLQSLCDGARGQHLFTVNSGRSATGNERLQRFEPRHHIGSQAAGAHHRSYSPRMMTGSHLASINLLRVLKCQK